MGDMDKEIAALRREIARKKIQKPGPDQYVGPCHWSKTGWGIWNEGGGCTCEPAKAPATGEEKADG